MQELTLIQKITIWALPVLFAITLHEVAHGWVAKKFGDRTAERLGRLSLNPLQHIDPIGTLLVPGLMLLFSNMIFGWAKPVPYNPLNLKDRKYGDAKVALAGPLGNFVIALFFGLFLRFFPASSLTFTGLLSLIVYINLVLMIFNLVPIPPLDGSKILAAFLPENVRNRYLNSEKYGFILVILFVMLAGGIIMPLVDFLYKIIVGA